ncbi:protein FAM47E isoform X2 [Aplysia californica]|uniref:Protein FAM47E isoform X2 n=1 Tax=Aplysia californica TaxID=6500 RepID=A0ABM1VP77_APLCA|nr:protein FAM47E isoform X2 [Aplysia californica]
MAEKKYDLALVNTLSGKPVKQQEWYKERLQTKYIKKLKPGERINSNNTQNWLFMKDGLDDFRDGLPPAVQGSDFLKSDKGPGPTIHGEFLKGDQVKQPAARKRLSRFQTYYSRCTPQQQQRRDYINEVEQGLLKHPLALYPHLEESVAPELFEDIVDLLDPQFNIQDMQDTDMDLLEEVEEKETSETASQSSLSRRSGTDSEEKQRAEDRLIKEATEGAPIRNPYRWLPRKDVKDKKDGKKAKEKDQKPWPTSPSEEEHIKKVTQEFCDWVADLGGESNNIEESTITSLFASGYETKPALSVPIHVVELTNVPQELRLSAAVPPPPPPPQPSSLAEEPKKRITGDYEPSWVKFKYGAWYLSPRTWKKMDQDEPLMDPKHLKDQEMSEAKKKSNALNQELASMHASKAFSDFITKKTARRPEFLVEVADIQRKAAEDEQKRQEAELLAKQKKTFSQQKEAQAAAY